MKKLVEYIRFSPETPGSHHLHTNNGNELNFTALLRFPFGFDGDDQAERHEDLVRYLQVFVQSKEQWRKIK